MRHEQGVAFVEFALTLPFLLTMIWGVTEITRYILITQKAEKLAHTIADVTAQSATITATDLNQILEATSHVMEPYEMGSNSRVIISSLYRNATDPQARVHWCYRGGGSMSATSHIGALGSVPDMPGGFTFNPRENVIAAEVFFQFSPLITTEFFDTQIIYRAAFYKPRLGALTNVSVSCS